MNVRVFSWFKRLEKNVLIIRSKPSSPGLWLKTSLILGKYQSSDDDDDGVEASMDFESDARWGLASPQAATQVIVAPSSDGQ